MSVTDSNIAKPIRLGKQREDGFGKGMAVPKGKGISSIARVRQSNEYKGHWPGENPRDRRHHSHNPGALDRPSCLRAAAASPIDAAVDTITPLAHGSPAESA
jgi:hypothetical protein